MKTKKSTLVRNFTGIPLMMREIRVFLRSHKSFGFMLIFLGALLVLVYLNWASFADYWRPDRDISLGARVFFYSLSCGHLFFIILIMPFLLVPSIVEERERQTLDLLISSPISVVHLVLAKLVSPLLFMFLLLTASIPVLSLCLLGGGLGMEEIGFTYTLFLATAVLFSCVGLFASTLRPRVYEVYLVSALLTLLLCLIVPYHGSVWNYLSELRWKTGVAINHNLQILSPFHVLHEVIFATSQTTRIMVFWIYLMLMVGMSGGLLMATFARVRRITTGGAEGQSGGEDEDEDDLLRIHDRDYDITFDQTSLEGNPGLVLERRVQWFARLPVLLRMFYSALMLSVITLPLASYQGSWLFLSLPFVSAALFTLPLAATSISSDRERETLCLLRTSLLSSQQIVHAKFIACLQYSAIIALALYLPGMTLQLLCGVLGYEVDLVSNLTDSFALVFYPIILFFSLVMYTAWGLYCSAFFQRSNRSLVIAGLVILTTLGAPFALPQVEFFALSSVSYFVTFLLSFLSPLVGIANLFPTGTIKYLERSMFDLHGSSLIRYGFTIGQCLFYVMATYSLLKRTVVALENQD